MSTIMNFAPLLYNRTHEMFWLTFNMERGPNVVRMISDTARAAVMLLNCACLPVWRSCLLSINVYVYVYVYGFVYGYDKSWDVRYILNCIAWFDFGWTWWYDLILWYYNITNWHFHENENEYKDVLHITKFKSVIYYSIYQIIFCIKSLLFDIWKIYLIHRMYMTLLNFVVRTS